MSLSGDRRQEAGGRSSRKASPASGVFISGAAAVAIALVTQTPVAVQEHQSRQTMSVVDVSSLRELDAAIDRRLRTGDLRTYRSQENPFLPGRRTERLAQYHEGLPVYGADLNRQTDGGVTTSVFGTQFTGVNLDTRPGLSMEAARTVFAELAGPAFELTESPTLCVLPTADDGYALTYRGTLSDMRTVFIDAGTGEVLFEFSNMREQDSVGLGTGLLGDLKKMMTDPAGGAFLTRDRVRPAELRTLDMEFDPDRFFDRLLGVVSGDAPTSDQDLSADADNQWEDGAVVDVHAALGWTYDYLFTQLGWAGIDGNNGAVDAFVRPFDSTALVEQLVLCDAGSLSGESCDRVQFLVSFLDNAMYFFPATSGSTGTMVFGEPFFLTRPLTALDIVAHELTHGVTFFTAGLGNTAPPNEPGAIDEGFSDIIGTAVEFYVQESGSGPLRADYLVGEDSASPSRSLRDPQEIPNAVTGVYPDHYDDLYRGPRDFGGVHINAPILGHIYYLAVEGGTNRTSGLSVSGVGAANRLQIERIFFYAWATLLPAFADFPITADCLFQAAVELFGASSAPATAIAQALDAVGIPNTVTCHDVGGCL
ncbi:MAG: M4 family metallopeptidase [Vicinamibacterales bacterium]|nr:M4 family metallopeptidase [Vicinamibacterales bacterium]MDP7478046.1 M4 family metallopeptidase [Vicinamibacterales bacterium]MDP7692081.1 M4 family metallopeptidase [Vicinamibacterales bacterium]HJN46307.1 M4 family metallopeptidase [Vicinamibacterales bacterium]